MRAARTDKGVSAVGQVVSLKMVLEPPGMLQRINDALPEQVRAGAAAMWQQCGAQCVAVCVKGTRCTVLSCYRWRRH
jgi:tRNA pseudouridine(38-40) synthase